MSVGSYIFVVVIIYQLRKCLTTHCPPGLCFSVWDFFPSVLSPSPCFFFFSSLSFSFVSLPSTPLFLSPIISMFTFPPVRPLLYFPKGFFFPVDLTKTCPCRAWGVGGRGWEGEGRQREEKEKGRKMKKEIKSVGSKLKWIELGVGPGEMRSCWFHIKTFDHKLVCLTAGMSFLHDIVLYCTQTSTHTHTHSGMTLFSACTSHFLVEKKNSIEKIFFCVIFLKG